jgi:hypothetical protein
LLINKAFYLNYNNAFFKPSKSSEVCSPLTKFSEKEFGISCSPTIITAKEYFSYQHVETVLPLLRYLDTILLLYRLRNFVLPARRKTFGIAELINSAFDDSVTVSEKI